MKKSKGNLLPIDTSILPNILSFGRVKGLARLFLEVEIVLSTLVVCGTLFLVFIHLFFRS